MSKVRWIVFGVVWMAASAVAAVTIPYVVTDSQSDSFAATIGPIANLRSGAATQLCDASEAELGIGSSDCSVDNVCVVKIVYCDSDGQALTNVDLTTTFKYPVNAVFP